MARHPPQTRYAQSSGAKIAYQVSGTGPPDLVMVPGLVSHLDIQWQQAGYRRFVRALERGGRLIRLDKRGTGLSDPGATLTILPGSDHLPWAGDWASVAGEVLRFLAQVASARKEQVRKPAARGRSRPARPAVGWPSLTEAELPVVRLAAEGHSNADIAARLCLSRYTVETHLKHVFAKLGVESRAMPADLVGRARAGGLFRLNLPRSLGGLELDPATTAEIFEEISRADGSAGWTIVIGNSTAFFAWLDPEVARELIGDDPDFVSTSMWAPLGHGAPDGSGRFAVSGRWPFNSGCPHAAWLQVGVMVTGTDSPRPDGAPDWRFAFVPARAAHFEDTWDAMGLRGRAAITCPWPA